MERMARITDDDAPSIEYRSPFNPGRIIGFGLLGGAVGIAGWWFKWSTGPAGAAVFFGLLIALLGFRRRSLLINPSADEFRESYSYLLFNHSHRRKLSDYKTLTVSVRADDNRAIDNEYTTTYEMDARGTGNDPVELFTHNDRAAVEKEAELLHRRLDWKVGWHASQYGD